MNMTARPRVLLLADVRGWAFDMLAQSISRHLEREFDCKVLYVHEKPEIRESDFDLIHVLYEQETYHRPFLSGKVPLIKHVASHEWQHQGQSTDDFARNHLAEADLVMVPSMKLFSLLKNSGKPMRLYAAGIDVQHFSKRALRSGPITIGWAGNPHVHEHLKNLPMLQSACHGLCELRIADGKIPRQQMPDFYNNIDVIVCSSRAEGNPYPLLEGMACGCFPVSFDVGIAPQLIEHNVNGILIPEIDVHALRNALQWCTLHADSVRNAWKMNVEKIRALRDERTTAQRIGDIYEEVLSYA